MILLPRHDDFRLLSKVSVEEAKETVDLWYSDRKEVLTWQKEHKQEACDKHSVCTLLGRARRFPSMVNVSTYQKGHIEQAAINTPVQVLSFFLTQSFMFSLFISSLISSSPLPVVHPKEIETRKKILANPL
jgi:DNA polymerase I-like protein with 3'-5' exonuclease and polymerase domains